MKFDEYSIKARLLPALVTSALPAAIFNYFYVSEEFSKFVGYILGIKLLSTISLSLIFLFFLSEFGRSIAKGIFEYQYFNDEMSMPTTIFMLYKDNAYSDEYKNLFRKKVKADFGLALADREQESNNELDAKRKIVECMAFVRKKLKENKFLLQHNIEYGAMRNAVGGAVIGIIFCIWNVYFFSSVFPNALAMKISYFLLGVYSILLICSRLIMKLYGRSYGKILFREYLGQTKN